MSEPRASRPRVPGYGIPATREGMLTWRAVERALQAAPRYWIATTDADGAAHVIQQWGAWVEGRLHFEGGDTRWARNLRRDPRVAVTVERGGFAIMLEGRAEELRAPERALALAIMNGYGAKRYGYRPRQANWRSGGLWSISPVVVFAWRFRAYGATATRFRFDR